MTEIIKQLEYKIKVGEGAETRRISRTDLRAAMCTTNECLSAGFNIQLQILVDLIDSSQNGEVVSLERISETDLEKLNESYLGITREIIQEAVEAYNNYAKNMFYI